MKQGILTVVLLIIAPFMMIYYGWSLTILAEWFAPFQVTLIQATGAMLALQLIKSLFNKSYKISEKETTEIIGNVLGKALLPLISLSFAWVVKLILGA